MCKNICSNCKFSSPVAGSAHTSCNYPKFKEAEKLQLSITILGNLNIANQFLDANFGFTVSQHPVSSGWFNFPFDFDPVWIEGECTKHSNNPDVMRGIEAENIVNSFMFTFKKVEKIYENDKDNSLYPKMKDTFQKFNSIQNQDEFFELIEELKPLIKEAEKL